MGHDKGKYEDQINLFALGLLKGYELRQLEEHLDAGCEICEKALRENELVLSSLAYSLEDSPLSPQVENKIFDRIEAQETAPSKTPKLSFWNSIKPIWLNLGSAVAVGLLVFLFANNMSLRNELSVQKQDIKNLQASVGKETEMMDFVMNPNVQTVKLAGTMSELNSSGKLLWDEDSTRALLLVSNIPTLEEGMTYQIWCIENGIPVSLGTFKVNENGEKMMEIKSMPRPSKEMEVLITLEPDGGMPHPTGATYLAGSI
jgi:anti-sigma-K factor RskA